MGMRQPAPCRIVELYTVLDCKRNIGCDSIDALTTRMLRAQRTVEHQFRNLTKKHPEDEDFQISPTIVGPTAIIENERHDRMQVGVAGSLWLLMYLEPVSLVCRETDEAGLYVFYLPEWTEFEPRELNPIESATAILTDWLHDGTRCSD